MMFQLFLKAAQGHYYFFDASDELFMIRHRPRGEYLLSVSLFTLLWIGLGGGAQERRWWSALLVGEREVVVVVGSVVKLCYS
jgi:hypothetical protein